MYGAHNTFGQDIVIETEPCIFEDTDGVVPTIPDSPTELPPHPEANGAQVLVPEILPPSDAPLPADVYVPDFYELSDEEIIQASGKTVYPSPVVSPTRLGPNGEAVPGGEIGQDPNGWSVKSLLVGALIGAAGAFVYWWFYGREEA
jgi:hypothetical protein